MNNNLISVIIPVYNSEQFIKRCLDSIIRQTYQNLEIIIINDGSTDNTENIIEEYKNKDNRIRLIHKENEGIARTRNRGLKEARGDYLFFVDSDDFVDSDIIEKLYRAINIDESELCVCGFVNTYDDYESISGVGLDSGKLDQKEYLRCMSTALYSVYYGALWNKIYSNEIIQKNKITFPTDIALAEDFIFNLRYLENVNSVSIIDDCAYHYYQDNSNSLTKKKNVDYLWKMAKIRYSICIEQYKKMNMYEECYNNIQNAIAYEIISPTYHIVKEEYRGFLVAKKQLKDLYNDQFVKEAVNKMNKPQMVHRIARISLKIHSYGLFVVLMRIWIKIQRYEG